MEDQKRSKEAKHRPRWKTVRNIALVILLVPVLAFSLLLGFLSLTEYKPAERMELSAWQEDQEGDQEYIMGADTDFSVLSWNIGYGALGDNADFFMDGGKGVMTASRERVEQNLKDIQSQISRLSPDFALLQEVDENSARSYNINQTKILDKAIPNSSNSFAYNFKVEFIPYPIPPIGKVTGGIMTSSHYKYSSAERISLPSSFSWPVRMANLKRCLALHRIQVSDGKELVLVNLHLEAYDSGEGKIAQTKMLRDVLQKEYDKGNYVIAAGDFNQIFDTVDSSAYPLLEGRWKPGVIEASSFGNDFQLLMDQETASCRSLDRPLVSADKKNFQYYIIDGFICSKNVQVESLKTQDLGFVSSDHNPVLLKARLIP